MKKELLNTQIEALTAQHGAEIVKFYKGNGFYVRGMAGAFTKEDVDDSRFYGVDIIGFFQAREFNEDKNIKTLTLEEAEALVYTKDFSKMDLETWLIETEKLGLSYDELDEHIDNPIKTDWENVFNLLDGLSSSDKAKYLYDKWNTKTDLYTEITAYKLQDGSIVESKELAEITAKEIKIKNELSNYFDEDFIIRIMQNLEKIKKIINQ